MNQPKLFQYCTLVAKEKWVFYLKFKGKFYRNRAANFLDIFDLLLQFDPLSVRTFSEVRLSDLNGVWCRSSIKDITELAQTTTYIPLPQPIIDYLESL